MFWNELRNWLNNTAANVVEKVLGYSARQRMHRAVAQVDRVINKIRNRTTVFTKKNDFSNSYDKVTLESEVSVYEVNQQVLDDIKNKGILTQEFGYRS